METPRSDSIAVRPATPADVPIIYEIEQMACTAPWSAAALAAQLSGDHAINMVAVDTRGAVLGYVFAAAVADELNIHYVVTHPDFRRCGIATMLVEAAIAKSANAGARSTFLEVRSRNTAARALYARRGFVAHAVRRKYYSDDNDDAIVMHRSI